MISETSQRLSGDLGMGGQLGRAFAVLFTITLSGIAASTSRASVVRSTTTYTKAVYSLPLTLDPILMNDTASLVASNLIYDGLLRFSPTLKIEGALAESWSTSSDGMTLTQLDDRP
jgi:ABC-type transport system substrate-binding protein